MTISSEVKPKECIQVFALSAASLSYLGAGNAY